MRNPIQLIENANTFSPFYFYSNFLKKVANFYRNNEAQELIEFRLVLESDEDAVSKNYFIDPITLPLFLSLCEQLKKYQKSPIYLHLSNNPGTINILEFLHRADFFYLVGNNLNPFFPLGKKIISYEDAYLGGFNNKRQRVEHKIRCYSLSDENLHVKINAIENEEQQRDYLVEHFTYKVKEHFGELLYENSFIQDLSNDFISILAELITNGVLHSKSETFTLMFSDRYKTKFSISDSGIGLYESLAKKSSVFFYDKFSVFNALSSSFKLNVSDNIKNSMLSIFETLYYSMLKDRQGLFDLMCHVVINCKGYFRLHNDNAQIIVSSRMLNELIVLHVTRKNIIKTHNSYLFGLSLKETYENDIKEFSIEARNQFLKLANSIFYKYNEDTRFSSIRLFEVKFRGVHIEVEVPNTI